MMTLNQLIAALQEQQTAGHGDAEVWTEGCDCAAPAGAISVEQDGTLMIERGNY